MDVKKSYELRKCDSKYVLFAISPPSYEMKPVVVADEYKKIHAKMWVFKQGNLFSIVMEYADKLCIFADCSEYAYDNGQMFFLREKWYAVSNIGAAFVLGMPVDKHKTMFINKEDTVLNYRTNDGWKQKKCKNIEQLPGYGIEELCLDILKIETEEGTFFVSIKNQFYDGYNHFKKKYDVKVDYNVEFNTNSQAKEVEFYKFCVAFKQKMLEAGFSVTANYHLSEEQQYLYDKSTESFILHVSASLNSYFSTDIVINVNLTALYSGIDKGVYEIICDKLHYRRVCDGVSLVQIPETSQKVLLIESVNECEKICCEQDKYGRIKLEIIKC